MKHTHRHKETHTHAHAHARTHERRNTQKHSRTQACTQKRTHTQMNMYVTKIFRSLSPNLCVSSLITRELVDRFRLNFRKFRLGFRLQNIFSVASTVLHHRHSIENCYRAYSLYFHLQGIFPEKPIMLNY